MLIKVHEIGVVLVGDEAAGKTNFATTCCNKPSTEQHTPTILNLSECITKIDRNNIAQISLWDTGGASSNDRLRSIAYGKAHIFVVMLDCTDPVSLQNACYRWLNQLRQSGSPKEIVMVGSHKDRRSGTRCNLQQDYLTEHLIRQKLRMHGVEYYECDCRSAQQTHNCLRMIVNRLLQKYKGKEYWQITTY